MAKEKKTNATADDDFDKLLGSVEKEFGAVYSGEAAAIQDEYILLDAPRLAWAYGGKLKLNAIHRLNGKESGGKTTLATYLCGQCQKRKFEKEGNYKNAHVVIIDNEHTFDVVHAKDLGLLLNDPITGKPLVHILRNKYVEDQCAAWEKIVESGRICASIYDSDAAAINKAEFDNEIGKANFGAGAKANGVVIKRMNWYVDTFKTPLFWISQERANQELMAHLPKPTGGEAVNFYPSTRFRVTPKEFITKSGEIVGITMKIKNYKNKTGIPFRECLLDVYFKDGPDYTHGINGEGQYLDMLLELGIIAQHGGWYYLWEDQPDKLVKMQGWGGVQNWFNEHPDVFQDFKTMVNEKMSGYDSALDKNTVEVDEEAEFQKEQKEALAKREAAQKEVEANEAESSETSNEVENPEE